MAPRAIPEAKWLVSQLHNSQAEQTAADALRLSPVQEVEHYVETILDQLGG